MNAITTLLRRSQPATHWLDTWLLPLSLFAMRLYLARVFFLAGLTKIQDWDTTVFLFTEEYRVPLLSPAVAAMLGTAGELLLPPLLLLGLAGRFAALGLFVLNIMAVVSYWHALEGSALEFHLQWGLMLLLLLAAGPGKLAVDGLIKRRCG